jgi:hypothetical protein
VGLGGGSYPSATLADYQATVTQWPIPLRQWAQLWWQRDPTHVLAATDIAFTPGGASGPFINFIMESYVSEGAHSPVLQTPIGPIVLPFDPTNTSSDSVIAKLQLIRGALSNALKPYVGQSVAQLPASLNVAVPSGATAPTPPEGLIPVVPDPATIINNLINFAQLGPLIVGAVILVAILVLLYLGIKRTIL